MKKECPTCNRTDFTSNRGMRMHHAKVHDKKLPNCKCSRCGSKYYSSYNNKYCDDCNSSIRNKPDDVKLPDGLEWTELTSYQRSYYKNKNKRIEEGRNRVKSNRRWLKEYKRERGCSICDENHPACLEFHHINDKFKHVSHMVGEGYSRDSILKEIDKCIILCANCHRKQHYDR